VWVNPMGTFFLLCITALVASLGLGILSPVLPVYAKELGATGVWIGTIAAAFSIARAPLMPVVGGISDTKGRKAFITVGLFIYTLASVGYVFAGTIRRLVLVRLVHGIGSAMVFPVVMAHAADSSPVGKEGSRMGLFNIAMFTGVAAGPFLGGFLGERYGMPSAFYAMGAASCLMLVLALVLLQEPETQVPESPVPTYGPLVTLLKKRVVRGMILARIIAELGRGSVLFFLPVYGRDVLGFSLSQIGIILGSSMLFTTVLLMPFGKMADVMNRIHLTVAGGVIGAGCLLLIPHIRGFLPIWALGMVFAFAGALAMPAMTAIAVDVGRGYGMGSAMGLADMAMDVGMILGPIMSGIVMDFTGIESIFYFGGSITLLGTAVFYFFLRGEPYGFSRASNSDGR